MYLDDTTYIRPEKLFQISWPKKFDLVGGIEILFHFENLFLEFSLVTRPMSERVC